MHRKRNLIALHRISEDLQLEFFSVKAQGNDMCSINIICIDTNYSRREFSRRIIVYLATKRKCSYTYHNHIKISVNREVIIIASDTVFCPAKFVLLFGGALLTS